jgi:hypothetical protein
MGRIGRVPAAVDMGEQEFGLDAGQRSPNLASDPEGWTGRAVIRRSIFVIVEGLRGLFRLDFVR